jgi:hypothetical protein
VRSKCHSVTDLRGHASSHRPSIEAHPHLEEPHVAVRAKGALEAFRTFLGGRGLDEATLTVRDGFEAMLDFYRDI